MSGRTAAVNGDVGVVDGWEDGVRGSKIGDRAQGGGGGAGRGQRRLGKRRGRWSGSRWRFEGGGGVAWLMVDGG